MNTQYTDQAFLQKDRKPCAASEKSYEAAERRPCRRAGPANRSQGKITNADGITRWPTKWSTPPISLRWMATRSALCFLSSELIQRSIGQRWGFELGIFPALLYFEI